MCKIDNNEIRRIREQKLNDPDINTMILFERTAKIIESAIGLELKNLRLTVAQVAVLTMLSRANGALSIDEMARGNAKEFNSMSALVNRMEKKELVRKTKKEDDLKTYIVLTDKGSILYHNKVAERSIHLILGTLSAEERAQFVSVLKKLRHTTSELLGLNYKPPFLT